MAADAPTPREFGRLEERVDTVIRDVAASRGELGAKIDGLSAAFANASTKQGERIGEAEKRLDALLVERRLVVAMLSLIQVIALTIFGAWIKGYFG